MRYLLDTNIFIAAMKGIAAQGLALGAVVVTDNLAEFRRVPGLLTENWLGPERR